MSRKRKMTCKKCGDKGFTTIGSETSKTGICPDCRLGEHIGVDKATIVEVKFE